MEWTTAYLFGDDRTDKKWTPRCLNSGRGVRVSLMISGCITFEGVGTLTIVDGNINGHKIY